MDAKLLCQVADFVVKLLEIKSKMGRVKTNEDVFSHGLIFDQHEMLMDHANSGSNGILGRIENYPLSKNANLPGFRTIKPHQRIHKGTLASAIFA